MAIRKILEFTNIIEKGLDAAFDAHNLTPGKVNLDKLSVSMIPENSITILLEVDAVDYDRSIIQTQYNAITAKLVDGRIMITFGNNRRPEFIWNCGAIRPNWRDDIIDLLAMCKYHFFK